MSDEVYECRFCSQKAIKWAIWGNPKDDAVYMAYCSDHEYYLTESRDLRYKIITLEEYITACVMLS